MIVEKENAPQMGVINVEKTGEYLASVVDTKDSKRLVYAVGGLMRSWQLLLPKKTARP